MDANPTRHWWQKKRLIAALVILFILSYPLSFIPACWTMMRLDGWKDRAQMRLMGLLYRPIAIALIESPHPVRNCVYWTVELGAPEGVAFERNYDRGVMWSYPGGTYTLLYY